MPRSKELGMSDPKPEVEQMWHDWIMTDALKVDKGQYRFLRVLPHDPRCKLCYAPFHGIGGAVVGALRGRKQCSLNPHCWNLGEEFAKSHPGGAEVDMA